MNITEKIKLWHRALKYRFVSDRAEFNFLLSRIKSGDTVFDIGAHKGGYTYWMQRAVGKNGKVIAFEPQVKGARLLKELFPHVTVEQMAVSSFTGETTLHVQPQSYDVSFEASLRDQYGEGLKELVVTTTIDDYCSLHSLKPSFIKIDVEGHELDVLKGGQNILQSARPFLLVEVEQRHAGDDGVQALFDFVKACGYHGSFHYKGSILSLSGFDAGIHQRMENVSNRKLYANNFMFEPKQPTAEA